MPVKTKALPFRRLGKPPLLKLDGMWMVWALVTVRIRYIRECTYENGPIIPEMLILKPAFTLCMISDDAKKTEVY